ncbi:MAG: PilZ protein [Alphaproteobacteria bacterium]|nr:PilZ protein [Alphaproteobacteria bacterium]
MLGAGGIAFGIEEWGDELGVSMGMEDEDDGAHKRRSKRSLVLIAAKVRLPSGLMDVRLRNLSQNGALLEAETMPPVNCELVFERGETIVPARVAWAARGRFGIEFLTPIEESEVLVHVGRPRAKPPLHDPGGLYRRAPLKSPSTGTASWMKPSGS